MKKLDELTTLVASSGGAPYHSGERTAQRRAGAEALAERVGRNLIRDFMPDQHRAFFAQLPLLIVGSLDHEGQPWASAIAGPPGFATSPDPHRLVISAQTAAGDPLAANIAVGAPIGLLGIDFATRRRNRMNGVVSARNDQAFTIEVRQSFGNCPKYIQARTLTSLDQLPPPDRAPDVVREDALLSARSAALLARADTCFIASASLRPASGARSEGVDVSHRGGRPGFVRVSEDEGGTTLLLPDFPGNFLFNTFGNIVVNPSAGLLAFDFESGDVLTLTGAAEVLWDAPERKSFPGAERLLRIRVESGVRIERALPFRFSVPEYSAQLTDDSRRTTDHG